MQPTVFSDVTPDMTIAKEEIFGPVLVLMPYDTEEEAIEIANGTPYGLAGAVWSADSDRAERVARQLRTGQVDINGGNFNPQRALRWLQAVGLRARAGQVRSRGVRRDQVDAALRAALGARSAGTPWVALPRVLDSFTCPGSRRLTSHLSRGSGRVHEYGAQRCG